MEKMFLGLRALPAAAFVLGMSVLPAQQAVSATTGLLFAGGCVQGEVCPGPDANANTTNVSLILGVDESLVTQVFSGFSVSPPADGTAVSGTWEVTDPSITHLAFKSDGYYILGEVTAASGDWMNDTSAAGSWVLSLATCPDTICSDGPRAYEDADFLTGGGQVAGLSNVRAFAVVPVPAAVWLFGSGLLGLVGIARRRRRSL